MMLLFNISNFCNVYYISYIQKKPLKRVQGAYFACCCCCCCFKNISRQSVYCVVRASLHGLTFALRSLATARFDLGCACETATSSPRVKKFWSAPQKIAYHTRTAPSFCADFWQNVDAQPL